MDKQIAQLGAEVLRQVAHPVDDLADGKFRQLIEDMQRLMQESNGVGIAAPQLGESWQAVIVASRPTPRYPLAPEISPILMINPRFEVSDTQMDKDWEGCLSIPGIRALVPRYRAVEVCYQDIQGQACNIGLKDFPARVFQHEYDHLLGKVYLDRVQDNIDIISETEFCKRMAA